MERLPTNGRENSGVKKGPWNAEEDQKLIAYVKRYGIWNWTRMPGPAGLARSGKSCRLRWMNYLRPNINLGNFTKEEEGTIIMMQQQLGNRWSAIAAKLPGRTDNKIKNYWNTHLKKRLSASNIKTETMADAPNSQAAQSNTIVAQKPSKEIVENLIPLIPRKDSQEDLGFGGHLIENLPAQVPKQFIFSPDSSSSNSAASFYDIYGNNQTFVLDVNDGLQNLCFDMFRVEDVYKEQIPANSRQTPTPFQELQRQSEFSDSTDCFEDFLFDLWERR